MILTETLLRPLAPGDFKSVASLLTKTLDQSILQKLGSRFIENHFLPAATIYKGLHNYVCLYQNQTIGYALFSRPEKAIQGLGKKIKLPLMAYTLARCGSYPTLFFGSTC